MQSLIFNQFQHEEFCPIYRATYVAVQLEIPTWNHVKIDKFSNTPGHQLGGKYAAWT